jgi:uncharacterized sulfatase
MITGNDPPKGEDRAQMLKHIAAVDTLPKLLAGAGYRSLQTGKWWEGGCQCGGFTEGMTHGDPKRGGRHGDVGLQIGRKTMAPAFDFIDSCAESKTPFFLWYAPFLPHTPHNPPERLLAQYRKEGVPEPIAKYQAMCTWFDETCGQLLDHVEARDLTRDTIVVLVTDNGWIQRPDKNGFAPRSKRTAYEGGVRTPILFSWPGNIEPAEHSFPVSSIDIDDPAQSLVTRWIIEGSHKLLVHKDPKSPDELYDLIADPSEQEPIVRDAVSASLRAKLDRWWDGR